MRGYQITLEDVENAQRLQSEPGRSAFLDESGGFGFNFLEDGVTRYYIVCAVIVNNAMIPFLENKIEVIRKNSFGGNEMKSSVIGSNHNRRVKLLTELLQLDFHVILLIADKKKFIENTPLTTYKESFVKFLHQRLYNTMYSVFPKLKIIEDEFGRSEFQKGYKNYVINHRPVDNIFDEYDFDYVDSKHSNIVQIADIIAGSVMQQLNNNKAPNVLKIFSGKIVDIINFPDAFQIYKPENNSDSKFDKAIYELSLKSAADYIEKNKNTANFEIKLRIHFLKYLLFNAKMYQESRYIYADEIISEIHTVFKKKIAKNVLYRRIVAPLRDEGVIIASSSHGYKIPKTTRDIGAYINQTVTVVGPMLSRIGKCRKKIKLYTDNNLDILEGLSLSAYRRYFGDVD